MTNFIHLCITEPREALRNVLAGALTVLTIIGLAVGLLLCG